MHTTYNAVYLKPAGESSAVERQGCRFDPCFDQVAAKEEKRKAMAQEEVDKVNAKLLVKAEKKARETERAEQMKKEKASAEKNEINKRIQIKRVVDRMRIKPVVLTFGAWKEFVVAAKLEKESEVDGDAVSVPPE
mmetsp:Transcript_49982/g.99540  ORF Transcript_49982/g.99540 Transcript_49982/m.99540 type:complete len:135 (-) Transcript_49982:136-540(-)|eukprot:CAMPEP_0174705106 /NCGR_PEP_ID=MMETSP1094-20130205/8451_1 /TAXON_ID=156173 /ORGANISM="Chrysochromulina brevifilum, Strain UTEX LB 985" /LENGTH=134 /DNA_ID=CAMNT_0015903229 /DNA_START=152 /DNA_END=556 /DNA_ORIENTATION=-